jgi:iron complex outermembrane receptor protein
MIPAFVAFYAVAIAASAQSQPRLHETIVVTASAEPVPFETAGRAVWVLTRADIARLPIRTFEDILRFASSVDVRTRGPYVQSDLSIRGGGFGQTLVLVDGMRINDAQSGHHNSDIPLTLDDIDRVEVLLGSGSSLFGADALAGTINIITRPAAGRLDGTAVAGDFGLAGGRVRAAFGAGAIQQSISAEAARSSGFDVDRDFENVTVSSRTTFGPETRVLFGFARKDFGAQGFYGPSPSRERTDQTVVALNHGFTFGGWRSTLQAMYRTHGDWFLYDRNRPGVAENVHRTHATTVILRGSRALGQKSRVSAGSEAGGDWIDSSNLGERSFGRGSAFVELQQGVGDRLVLYPGIRYDAYSRFGDAWSPAVAARFSLRPSISLRASTGHAFRVPTFTERYYTDPNHNARDDLAPERGWGTEAGADWIITPRSMVRATVFSRRDRDVIDWIRPSAAERWRTTNVRRVATAGVEIGMRQLVRSGAWIDLQYTHLDTSAAALGGMLSKYVLDYAPHNLVLGGLGRAPLGVDVSPRVAWTRRNDGRSHAVVDLRGSRTIKQLTVFVDAGNLFNETYQEIVGVAMPGRWVSAGARVSVGAQ